jgi:hypothetical protein
MAKHEEAWGGFPSEFEDVPALVTADLGWAEEGPDPRRGMLIRVRVATPEPDENDGLAPFLEHVAPFDDAITAELSKKLNAVPVGQLISGVSRWWCFYASRADGAQDIVSRAAAKAKDIAPEVVVEDDPEWNFYADVLFPDDGQQRYMADESVIAQLVENGDNSEIPRPIEHLAILPDTPARDRFVEWCADNGFAVTEAADEYDDEFEGYPVEFTHVGPASLEEIFEKTSLATEGAEQFEGEYDGWQTSIMK